MTGASFVVAAVGYTLTLPVHYLTHSHYRYTTLTHSHYQYTTTHSHYRYTTLTHSHYRYTTLTHSHYRYTTLTQSHYWYTTSTNTPGQGTIKSSEVGCCCIYIVAGGG